MTVTVQAAVGGHALRASADLAVGQRSPLLAVVPELGVVVPGVEQRRKGLIQLVGTAHLQDVQMQTQHPGGLRQALYPEAKSWRGRIHQHRHARELGHGLLE